MGKKQRMTPRESRPTAGSIEYDLTQLRQEARGAQKDAQQLLTAFRARCHEAADRALSDALVQFENEAGAISQELQELDQRSERIRAALNETIQRLNRVFESLFAAKTEEEMVDILTKSISRIIIGPITDLVLDKVQEALNEGVQTLSSKEIAEITRSRYKFDPGSIVAVEDGAEADAFLAEVRRKGLKVTKVGSVTMPDGVIKPRGRGDDGKG